MTHDANGHCRVSVADGATETSFVTVQFSLGGIGIATDGVEKAKTGHHHLLIDVTEVPAMNSPTPADD
ncbi:MAG: DUF4399 domain-containing protein [Gammaproteobacteria bacterium]|nr:MAG: DUF4399 domain-containing protein [Gammaproteobacteria bacterium]